MDILSTRSVSEMLGVSEATVKRWSDAGTLKCFKTPGGHRKFRLRDVKSFLADQGDEPVEAPSSVPVSTSETPIVAHARKLALQADVDALVSFLASDQLDGHKLAQAFDESVMPAMQSLQVQVERGQITPAQMEHAKRAMLEALARVRPLVERGTKPGDRRALCTAMVTPSELHLRLLGLVLQANGFRTMAPEGATPAAELALHIANDPPAVLVLFSDSDDGQALRGDLAVIASAAGTAGTQLLVGGTGFVALDSLPGQAERYQSLTELASRTKPTHSA